MKPGPFENHILLGDALDMLRTLPDEFAQMCVTSPPYWGLRDYGVDGQIGLEKTLNEYVARLVEIFREVHRVLREDGTLWLNLGGGTVAIVAQNLGRKWIGIELNPDYKAMAERRIAKECAQMNMFHTERKGI